MMKLGTQTASLVNNLYSRGVIGEPVPEVGMGVHHPRVDRQECRDHC